MSQERVLQGEAPGQKIKNGQIGSYGQAWLASQSGTTEGIELAQRWKRLYLRYVNLSGRYHANTRHFQALRLAPEELAQRYHAVDDQFDELEKEILLLYADLGKWTAEHVEITQLEGRASYRLKYRKSA
jgi:hypothetical protein